MSSLDFSWKLYAFKNKEESKTVKALKTVVRGGSMLYI